MNAIETRGTAIEAVEAEINDGIFPLERAIAAYVHHMRERCKNNTDITHLRLEVNASGPVHSGEMKIEFAVSFNSWGGEVKSHTIAIALAELERRHGFDQKNQGLLLTQLGDVART